MNCPIPSQFIHAWQIELVQVLPHCTEPPSVAPLKQLAASKAIGGVTGDGTVKVIVPTSLPEAAPELLPKAQVSFELLVLPSCWVKPESGVHARFEKPLGVSRVT